MSAAPAWVADTQQAVLVARHLSLGRQKGRAWARALLAPGSGGEGRGSWGDAQGFGASELGHGEVWENLPHTAGSELGSNSCQVLPEP